MRNYFLIICVLLLLPAAIWAQKKETDPNTWHGFKRIHFTIDSTPAYMVVPPKALPGNPWLWRSYSPDFHIEIDSILVAKGFYIGFLDVNNKLLYGQPALMQQWERFYDYLVNEKHFAATPALEGAVRGTLCEFAWAKKHPDKVSCIYSENPVSEIKSWPGGKLKDAAFKGSGAPDNWNQLKSAYGFTEEEALQYHDNPKDNLEQLADHQVPLYFSFGLHDQLIPMDQNALVIANNYVKLGGPVTLRPMTKGKQEANGHHVTIENPEAIADFIIRASMTKIAENKH
ncbi:MAG: hypothetical protein J0H85_15745 [Sediminibacterium magnilacihabitans]|jgi:hypothetical protein|nr:hypothetical protein [Sediminibacterium magnilacihabitans]PQV58060.1 hypothetical protein CLV53_1233 [Sediminibacterium magnilacihabitans]